jgi:hypothetical protein
MIAPAVLDELRARVPVSAVVGRRVRLTKAGRELKGLSPFNKERTPSFFVNDQKQFWHDFSSGKHGDIFNFVMETEGRTFPQAVDEIAAMAGVSLPATFCSTVTAPAPVIRSDSPPEKGREPDADELLNQRRALKIWESASDLGGTLAMCYLAGRKLSLPAGLSGHSLRFHARCPWRDDEGRLVGVPAAIGLYRDVVTNEPRAINRIALAADGRKLGRKALGPKAGCAIKLTADEDVSYGLHIGEGIETMLAAMMLGFSPAWALGDTGNVSAFPALPGIDVLTLIVDHDTNGAGQDAASGCYDRWTAAEREVWSIVPDKPGADMNDVVGDAA